MAQNVASKPSVFGEVFEKESRLPKRNPVLVVEDDRELRESLKATLQGAGFSVVEAANGEEALRLLGRNASISVILLDVVMPVMDGWEFRAAQKRDPELAKIPVVAMSGFQKEIDDRPIDSDAFLPKPVRAEVLIETVRNCCGP